MFLHRTIVLKLCCASESQRELVKHRFPETTVDLLNMRGFIGAYVFLTSFPGGSNAYQSLRIMPDVS